MKYLGRSALCLIVVFALGAAGSSVASAALPEFIPGAPPGIESILKTTKLETVGKVVVTCKHGSDSGEVIGPKQVTLKIDLTECKIPGALCTTPGAKLGEIVTNLLIGELGYIKKSKKQVGLDLFTPAGPITTFGCGAALGAVVEGSVIGKIAPVNTLVLPGGHFTLKFSEKLGKQNPPSFEAGPIDVLETSINGGKFEESGLAGTDEVFFAAPQEIKA